MKPATERKGDSDDRSKYDALPLAFKWMKIRGGVYRFRSHEDADRWWEDHLVAAYRKAKEAGATDHQSLRQFLESQDITPPE